MYTYMNLNVRNRRSLIFREMYTYVYTYIYIILFMCLCVVVGLSFDSKFDTIRDPVDHHELRIRTLCLIQ